ncbi:FRG domain-containing protein [Fusibacter sp. JL298sf-3]
MLYNLDNVKMYTERILDSLNLEGNISEILNSIENLIQKEFSTSNLSELILSINNELKKIDKPLILKAESVLEFKIDSKDEIDKKISIIGYELYNKKNALSFLTNQNVCEDDNTKKDLSESARPIEFVGGEEVSVVNFLMNEYGIENDQITEVTSLSEYMDYVKNLSGKIVSRGYSNFKYHFLPSGHRSFNNVYFSNLDIRNLQAEFKRKATHYYPEFKNKTAWEITAFAQHYGLPTYMLDFTESHLVSLLFSLENLDSTSAGIVLFIDYQGYNSKYHSLDYIVDCSDVDFVNSNGNTTDVVLKEIKMPIFVKSDSLNDRIHFQKGVFLLFPNEVDLNKNGNYMRIKEVSKHSTFVIIPQNIKEKLIEELFKIGMNFESIYPDLDNAVRSIKFKSFLDGRDG